MRRRRAKLVAAAAVALAALATVAQTSGATDPLGRRTVVVGRSVEGRLIVATETGDFDSPRKALVVGCIHGNECAGIAVADVLAHRPPPAELDLWVVHDLNPDGRRAGIRQNARGVDLNRNFPWRWRSLGGVYDSGPHPWSEPETRAAGRLVARVRPAVSIWFHQHLDVVDDSSGNVRLERGFARSAGMRLARLTREPGSAVTWETHCLGGTAFVVELAAGPLGTAQARRLASAVLATAAATTEARLPLRPGCTGPPP